MERNEARGKLDLNPIDGLDDPLTPINMTTDPTGTPANDPPADPNDSNDDTTGNTGTGA